jgi:hypothetical protein
MNQASIFFRVFDLAFFAPGLVVLLPVWWTSRTLWQGDKIDLVSGIMTAGAWILLSYAVGLLIHGIGRLSEDIGLFRFSPKPGTRRFAIGVGVLVLLGCVTVLALGAGAWAPLAAWLAAALAVGFGRAYGRAHYQVIDGSSEEGRASILRESMVGLFDRDKQQELGLYFWYLRATANNIAVAIPFALLVWTGLALIMPPEQSLTRLDDLLSGTRPVVVAGMTAAGGLAAFFLSVGGREYHRAWKHARTILADSRAAGEARADATAFKPKQDGQ